MTLAKRIIPCLDVDKGRVVKGVRFVDLRDAGDPVELAASYDEAGADEFGSQAIVVAIDAQRAGTSWEVFVHGGRTRTGLDAVDWARRACDLGAGEILLTSMDADGTTAGYDIALTSAVASAVPVPVIASGGAGTPDHLADAVDPALGGAEAALAASVFHFGEFSVLDAKRALETRGLPVRMPHP